MLHGVEAVAPVPDEPVEAEGGVVASCFLSDEVRPGAGRFAQHEEGLLPHGLEVRVAEVRVQNEAVAVEVDVGVKAGAVVELVAEAR